MNVRSFEGYIEATIVFTADDVADVVVMLAASASYGS